MPLVNLLENEYASLRGAEQRIERESRGLRVGRGLALPVPSWPFLAAPPIASILDALLGPRALLAGSDPKP